MWLAVFFQSIGQGVFLERNFFVTAIVMRGKQIDLGRLVSQRMRLVSQRICPKSNSVLTLLHSLCKKAKERAGERGWKGEK